MKRFLLFITAIFMVFSIIGSEKDYVQWWVLNHGDYANTNGKNDSRVKWAFRVFDRVSNVADRVAHRSPRFFIIKTRGEPYAIAIPDGGIIITPSTLDICYTKVKPQEGDKCLAFILGHELAHLAHDDFMHREAFLLVKKYGEEKANKEIYFHFHLSNSEKAKEFRLKELMADQKGAIYAAMAGYDICDIVGEANNFLSLWANQIGIKNFYETDYAYPSFKTRVDLIRLRLKSVIEKVELFRAGVLLYQKGSYDDAKSVFSEFLKIYPSREVFSNIGACFFNNAMLYLHQVYPEIYYKFRISVTFDYTTSADELILKSVSDYLKDEIFMQYIKKAEKFFRMSVQKDANNKTSRINLSAALILKGEYARAQGECDHILKKYPDDIKALNNKGISFYYYGKKEDMDTIQKAIHFLERAITINPNDFEVLYNLAVLKTERKRMVGAHKDWENYLKLAPRDNFYYRVCRRLEKGCLKDTEKYSPTPKLKRNFRIKLGDRFSTVKKNLKNTQVYEYKLGSEKSMLNKRHEGFSLVDLQVMVKDNLRILFLGDLLELIELKLDSRKNVQEMLVEYGQPEKIIRHACGNFYVFSENGFSFKEVDGNVRSYIWFGKEF